LDKPVASFAARNYCSAAISRHRSMPSITFSTHKTLITRSYHVTLSRDAIRDRIRCACATYRKSANSERYISLRSPE